MEVDVSPSRERSKWLQMRKGKFGYMIGASDAAQAIGVSRYAERDGPLELYNRILGIKKKPFVRSECLEFGQKQEPRAIQLYSKITGWEVAKGRLFYANPYAPHAKICGFLPGDEHRFGVSLDARVYPYGIMRHEDKWFGMEAKCPFGAMYSAETIYDTYMIQMQMQMAVAGMRFTDYTVVKFDRNQYRNPPTDIILKRVFFCPEYWDWMLPKLRRFSECLERRIAPQVQATAVPHFSTLCVKDLFRVDAYGNVESDMEAEIPRYPVDASLFKLGSQKSEGTGIALS
jgi:hypothetical protein